MPSFMPNGKILSMGIIIFSGYNSFLILHMITISIFIKEKKNSKTSHNIELYLTKAVVV
jgi:hypothetical protein